jgi:hypothetical protein
MSRNPIPITERLLYNIPTAARVLGCDLRGSSGHSLDRIDNSKPHFASNVVPACGVCNRVRSDRFTYEEMLRFRPVLQSIRLMRFLDETGGRWDDSWPDVPRAAGMSVLSTQGWRT